MSLSFGWLHFGHFKSTVSLLGPNLHLSQYQGIAVAAQWTFQDDQPAERQMLEAIDLEPQRDGPRDGELICLVTTVLDCCSLRKRSNARQCVLKLLDASRTSRNDIWLMIVKKGIFGECRADSGPQNQGQALTCSLLKY